MNLDQWHIITCRTCGGVMKLPKTELSGKAACPHCANPLEVPTAVIKEVAQEKRAPRPRPTISTATAGISDLKSGPSGGGSGLQSSSFGTPASPVGDFLKRNLLSSLKPAAERFGGTPAAEKLDKPAAEAKTDSHLPVERTTDDAFRLRTEKENWETTGRALKEVDFKDKLSKTTEVEVSPTDPSRRKKKRRSSRADKLARLESQGWDNGMPKRPQRSLGSKLRRIPWGLVFLFLAFIAFTFYVTLKSHFKNLRWPGSHAASEEAAAKQTTPTAIQLRAEDKLEFENTVAFLPETNRIVGRFLQARTINEMLQYVREPSRVEPLMQQYYTDQGDIIPVDYRTLLTRETLTVHKRFISGVIETNDFKNVNIVIEKTPETYKIDWESYVAYSEMSMERFRQSKPKESKLFRVLLTPENYWNHEFADSKSLRCYRLTNREGTEQFFGYVNIDNPTYDHISQALVGAPNRTIHCVLRLRYPEKSSEARQVEITEYLETGWAFREDDFNMELLTTPKVAPPLPEASPPPEAEIPLPATETAPVVPDAPASDEVKK